MVKFFIFFSFSFIIFSESRKFHKDFFGRNYLVSKQKYFFSLDSDYKRAIPDLSQVYLHLEEAKELEKKRKFIEAIQLNLSIIACSEFGRKDRTFISEAKKNLGRIVSKYSDLEKKIQILTDITGCSEKEELFLLNESFPYKIYTDSRFNYIFPKDEFRFIKEEKNFNSKFSYFKIQFQENKDDPSLEEVYEKYNHELFYGVEKFITLMIGEVFFKEKFSGEILDFWDNRRGLNQTIKNSIQYQRKEFDSYFESNFYLVDKSKYKRKFFMKEKYFFKNEKSILVILMFPEETKEKAEKIFSQLRVKF